MNGETERFEALENKVDVLAEKVRVVLDTLAVVADLADLPDMAARLPKRGPVLRLVEDVEDLSDEVAGLRNRLDASDALWEAWRDATAGRAPTPRRRDRHGLRVVSEGDAS